MCFCSYYREFIPGFSFIAKPLHVLIQDGIVNTKGRKGQLSKDLVWNDEANKSWLDLKLSFEKTPVLGYPIRVGQFVLDTDASAFCISGALHQYQDGKLIPLDFASNSLNSAQRNY